MTCQPVQRIAILGGDNVHPQFPVTIEPHRPFQLHRKVFKYTLGRSTTCVVVKPGMHEKQAKQGVLQQQQVAGGAERTFWDRMALDLQGMLQGPNGQVQ